MKRTKAGDSLHHISLKIYCKAVRVKKCETDLRTDYITYIWELGLVNDKSLRKVSFLWITLEKSYYIEKVHII